MPFLSVHTLCVVCVGVDFVCVLLVIILLFPSPQPLLWAGHTLLDPFLRSSLCPGDGKISYEDFKFMILG